MPMTITHEDWVSPNSFTNGMVQVTARIRPNGDIPILTILSMLRSSELLDIIADRLP